MMVLQDYCRYWPRVVGEVLETGPYVIKLTASAILNDSLTTFDMIVQSKVIAITRSCLFVSPFNLP